MSTSSKIIIFLTLVLAGYITCALWITIIEFVLSLGKSSIYTEAVWVFWKPYSELRTKEVSIFIKMVVFIISILMANFLFQEGSN